MLRILKAQFIGNLVYGLLRIGEHVFGSIYDFTLNVFPVSFLIRSPK